MSGLSIIGAVVLGILIFLIGVYNMVVGLTAYSDYLTVSGHDRKVVIAQAMDKMVPAFVLMAGLGETIFFILH